MSDMLSIDSGPESEYDFNDLNDDEGSSKGNPIRKKLGGNLSGRKPASALKVNIKRSTDTSKPPIMLGKTSS